MSIDATRSTWRLTKKQVTSTEKLFLLSCADRAGEEGTCWPSVKRLAVDTCLDKKTISTVRNAVIEKNLVELTGEMKGRTKSVPVMRLLYINHREDGSSGETPIAQSVSRPNNGTTLDLSRPENGPSSRPENGTAKQTRKRVIEPKSLLNLKEEPKSIINKDLKRQAAGVSAQNMVQSSAVQFEQEKQVAINANHEYQDTYYQGPSALSAVDYIEPEQLPSKLKKEFELLKQANFPVTANDLLWFEEFFSLYPKSSGRKQALFTWYQERCFESSPEIYEKLKAQVAGGKYFKKGFVQEPANYLRGERWKDEAGDKVVNLHDDTSWADVSKRSIFETW